ncbi:MAG: thioredoxin family protein [Gammaproteobacteria bacterium]|nr:thioredoxin family protein [Gammaproteobacteria bacterium]
METKLLPPTFAMLCLLVARLAVADGVEFHALTYEEAAARAAADEKIVFIDFFTTWCLPCKEMDRTTFQDPQVAAWLAEHTVALKVDAEENETNEALAERFGVKSFPNYVYLTPEGELLDRITGKKDSEEFLELSASVIAGDNAVIRAQRTLAQGDENDPMLRMQLADAYREMGRYDEALREYLWCFDEGAEHDPAYSGVRLSFLLGDIERLGTSYPPAREALVERRDAAKQRILDREPGDEAARVFARINDTLGESAATLALFDSLNDNDVLHAEAARTLVREVFDLLVDAARYGEIISHLDVPGRAAFHLRIFDDEVRREEETKAKFGEVMMKALRDVQTMLTREAVAACYQVLVGVGEHVQAASIASKLIERLRDAETLNALAWAGYRTGSPVEENLAMAREAYAQTSGDNLPIVDTFARLLAVMGHRDEAVSIAEAGLAKATSDDDRTLMEQCLEYCRGP